MYYPVARENELTVSDIDNNPVIAGYVSAAQTIHTFDIKYFQPVYNAELCTRCTPISEKGYRPRQMRLR